MRHPLTWLKVWLQRAAAPQQAPPSDRARAQALVAAIDAGGIPLNPGRVNAIARSLGLEVSVHAPMDATILRIRAALVAMPPDPEGDRGPRS